jgi:hypothetical protein
MSKTVRIEHALRGWEKKYGYIGLSTKERDFFAAVKGKRFTLNILGQNLYERKIDDAWRIYVSGGALEDFEVDDVLITRKDEKGNYYIEKGK